MPSRMIGDIYYPSVTTQTNLLAKPFLIQWAADQCGEWIKNKAKKYKKIYNKYIMSQKKNNSINRKKNNIMSKLS